MVTKKELDGLTKSRILILGPPGSGKSFTSVKTAERRAMDGDNITYMDMVERSAVEELRTLNDETLASIDYSTPTDYVSMFRRVEDCKSNLLIVDPLHYITRVCRREVRLDLISQGWYRMGEKKITIENPDIFDLDGWLYSIANRKEEDWLDVLINIPGDIICTADPDQVNKPEKWYGYFDTILQLSFATESDGTRLWKYQIIKYRGKIFSKKYGVQTVPRGLDVIQAVEALSWDKKMD